MTLWIVLAAVLSYLLGVWGTYRVLYTRSIENHYKAILECSTCYMFRKSGEHGDRSTCSRHTIYPFEDTPLWFIPLVVAIFWLPIVGGYGTFVGIKWIGKKSFFPRGVQSPAKREWEALVQEARIERTQKELEKAKRKLT